MPRGKFATTNQKHYPDLGSDTSSVWSFCVISRENQQWRWGMSAFFLGCFKSNHRHSELTNRNVALRAAHCNSRIWICRKKRYQRKEWEQRKKKVYISGGIQEIAVRMWLEAVQCSRGKTYCTFNTRDISWDSGDIFCPLNVGFCELASQKQKNQHWEERAQLFVGIMGTARVSQLTVTRIGAGKSKFITRRKLSLTIKMTFSD